MSSHEDALNSAAIKLWGMSAASEIIDVAKNLEEGGDGFDAVIAKKAIVLTLVASLISVTKGHDMAALKAQILTDVGRMFDMGEKMGVSADSADKIKEAQDTDKASEDAIAFLDRLMKEAGK